MKLYVDFIDFDERTKLLLRESMPLLHWNEWTGMRQEQDRPDISLVYANHLHWYEASRKSNLASGKWIVLVGANSPKIGLPILNTFFKWSELNHLIDLKDFYQEDSQLDSYASYHALTIPGALSPPR